MWPWLWRCGFLPPPSPPSLSISLGWDPPPPSPSPEWIGSIPSPLSLSLCRSWVGPPSHPLHSTPLHSTPHEWETEGAGERVPPQRCVLPPPRARPSSGPETRCEANERKDAAGKTTSGRRENAPASCRCVKRTHGEGEKKNRRGKRENGRTDGAIHVHEREKKTRGADERTTRRPIPSPTSTLAH